MKKDKLSRRTFIRNTSLIAAGAVAGTLAGSGYAAVPANIKRIVKKGRINQSVKAMPRKNPVGNRCDFRI